MGPSRARDQKPTQDVLLREKDSRIATLEARLEAYSARASTAHTRLLKTIDVLDALRSQHALEIAAEEPVKTKLVQEANGWRSMAKSLEVERDELKDVVEDLIEKVALPRRQFRFRTNGARGRVVGCISRNMQRGNLNLESPEPAALGTTHSGGMCESHNDDLLAYATSIIARLRMELDVERQRHSRAVEEANLRVEELEAKVAVREAELESCITSPDGNVPQPIEQGPRQGPVQKRRLEMSFPEPKPLSDEECLCFLESNNARNRSLEIEIRRIAERLEQARIVVSASSDSGGAPQSSTTIPTLGPRARSASVDSNALSRALDAGRTTLAPVSATPSTMLSIAQLDNQIRTMTTQMDALVSERTNLIEVVARQRRVADGINMDTFQDVLRVEGECVRLQAEVDDLREQLQHARSSARAREKALLREIAQLRAFDLRPSHNSHHDFGAQPLEDDITVEESMELASPLTPTVILNPLSVTAAHTLDSEGDLVSLPFSPRHMSSPPPDAPPTPSRAVRRSPSPQDMERVQAALDVARTRLAQKEEALVELRAEMERLQQEMRTGNGDGG